MNEYKEIEFFPGSTIESCVKKLLEYLPNKVYGSFNGHKLYSDTVTLDSAYKEITGMTLEEYKIKENREAAEYERKKKEHTDRIPELTKEWIKKGHKILDEDKWDDWGRCVPIRLGDLYQGMELRCTLDIISELKAGKPYSLVKQRFIDQGHSGLSFSLVCSMISSFYHDGKEFIRYVREN